MNGRIKIALGLVGVMLGSLVAVGVANQDAPAAPLEPRKLGICHATGFEGHPYLFIVVERNGTQYDEHASHGGDILDVPDEGQCPSGGGSILEVGETPSATAPAYAVCPPGPTPSNPGPPASNDSAAPEACRGDVAVHKTGALMGDRVVFNLTVSSVGTDGADGVQLFDRLADLGRAWGLEFGAPPECSLVGRELRCEFGAMPVGEVRTVSVSAPHHPADCGTDIGNTALVRATNDANRENDVSTAVVDVAECPTPTPTPTPSPPSGGAGGGGAGPPPPTSSPSPSPTPAPSPSPSPSPSPTPTPTPSPSPSPTPQPAVADVSVSNAASQTTNAVEFAINVTNLGPDEAAGPGVFLNDSLPLIGGAWSLGGPDSASCTVENEWLRCVWAQIPANESRNVAVTGTLEAPCGDDLTSVAIVWAANDPNPDNNQANATADRPECPAPDASLNKTAQQTQDSVTFTLVTTSQGNVEANNVTLTDPLPDIPGAQWSLGGPDAAACILDANNLTCAYGTVVPGDSRTVAVTGSLLQQCNETVNTAFVSADQDADPTNDSSSATIQARAC